MSVEEMNVLKINDDHDDDDNIIFQDKLNHLD